MVLGLIVGVLLLLFLLGWVATVYMPARLFRHPESRDVLIGSGGLVAAGKFMSWQMMGASIQAVRYDPADPAHCFAGASRARACMACREPWRHWFPFPKPTMPMPAEWLRFSTTNSNGLAEGISIIVTK